MEKVAQGRKGLPQRGHAGAGRRAVVRVVFFGPPDFAVPSLRALLGEGFDVVAVVTQPDAPQGRSRSQLIPPPVKEVAEAEDLTVLQPDKPTGAAFLDRLRELRPDVGVVVAYGHLLKPA